MERKNVSLALILLGSLVAAPPAAAQDGLFGDPDVTLEIHGGGSGFGRFLLQAPERDDFAAPQRELSGDPAFSYGGAVSVDAVPRTAIRLGFTRASPELSFEDDRGVDDDALEDNDVGRLASNIFDLQVVRGLLSEEMVVSPFIGAGLALGLWDLDEGETSNEIRAGGDGDLYTRIGGVGTLGIAARPTDALGVRLAAATYSIGNPFTGEESLIVEDEMVIDEPKRVPQVDLRLSLSYTFGAEPRGQREVVETEDETETTASAE